MTINFFFWHVCVFQHKYLQYSGFTVSCHTKNQDRLCVIQKHQGFRYIWRFWCYGNKKNYQRINEEKIVLLERDTTTFVPRVYDQVFPETSGLVALESKIYVSRDNPQKTMRGVRSYSKNCTGTLLLPKVSGLINHGNTCYMNSVMQCLDCHSSGSIFPRGCLFG